MGWGGQEMRILSDCRGLMARDHKAVIVCPPGSRIAERAIEEKIPVIRMPMSRGRMALDIAVAQALLRRYNVDIVNTHSATDSWIFGIAGRMVRAKVVRTRHLSHPIRRGIASSLLYGRIPNAIVTTGESIRRTMIDVNRVRADRIISIPTGADLKRFDPQSVSADGARGELGIPADAPVIITVAMLRAMKGHRYLVEAAPRVLDAVANARFLFVGDIPSASPLRDQIEQRIRELGLEGSFILAGLREDVPSLLAASDIMALPSIEGEGVPQSVTQAMAMALPVVASDVGSVSDAVVGGETGLLVPPRDPDALAGSLIKLLQDKILARRMGAAGRKLVETSFSAEQTINRTIALYEALLAGRPIAGK